MKHPPEPSEFECQLLQWCHKLSRFALSFPQMVFTSALDGHLLRNNDTNSLARKVTVGQTHDNQLWWCPHWLVMFWQKPVILKLKTHFHSTEGDHVTTETFCKARQKKLLDTDGDRTLQLTAIDSVLEGKQDRGECGQKRLFLDSVHLNTFLC